MHLCVCVRAGGHSWQRVTLSAAWERHQRLVRSRPRARLTPGALGRPLLTCETVCALVGFAWGEIFGLLIVERTR